MLWAASLGVVLVLFLLSRVIFDDAAPSSGVEKLPTMAAAVEEPPIVETATREVVLQVDVKPEGAFVMEVVPLGAAAFDISHIAGIVVDVSGKTLEGAQVELHWLPRSSFAVEPRELAPPLQTVLTDVDGRFVCEAEPS